MQMKSGMQEGNVIGTSRAIDRKWILKQIKRRTE